MEVIRTVRCSTGGPPCAIQRQRGLPQPKVQGLAAGFRHQNSRVCYIAAIGESDQACRLGGTYRVGKFKTPKNQCPCCFHRAILRSTISYPRVSRQYLFVRQTVTVTRCFASCVVPHGHFCGARQILLRETAGGSIGIARSKDCWTCTRAVASRWRRPRRGTKPLPRTMAYGKLGRCSQPSLRTRPRLPVRSYGRKLVTV